MTKIPDWQLTILAQDRAYVLSPEFVRLVGLAHREGLLLAILRAANLDLSPELASLESRAWLPSFPFAAC